LNNGKAFSEMEENACIVNVQLSLSGERSGVDWEWIGGQKKIPIPPLLKAGIGCR
jgi:hypothetical protein